MQHTMHGPVELRCLGGVQSVDWSVHFAMRSYLAMHVLALAPPPYTHILWAVGSMGCNDALRCPAVCTELMP